MDKIGYSLSDSVFEKVHNTLSSHGMPTDNFLKNIRTLKVTSSKNTSSSYNSKNGYNPNRNTITLTDECNLIHELFKNIKKLL